jgi:hypothetical protein
MPSAITYGSTPYDPSTAPNTVQYTDSPNIGGDVHKGWDN